MEELESLRVITLVDNDVWERGLASSWGLSFYVEAQIEGRQHKVLMDTSGSSDALFGNTSKLGVDFSALEALFISHWHSDHCGSLGHILPLLRRSNPIYVPSLSLYGFKTIVEAGGFPKVCSKPTKLMEGMMSTGEMGNGIEEHSLLINVKKMGLVVLTGCSHPGIIDIAKRAQEVSGIANIYAVMGGFHISSVHEGINVAKSLCEMGVKLISPCHCTHIEAKTGIAKVIGEGYVRNGSGRIISIGCSEPFDRKLSKKI